VTTEAARDEYVVEARARVRPGDEGVLSDGTAATTATVFFATGHGDSLLAAIFEVEFSATVT
jgi:hypothetical protein